MKVLLLSLFVVLSLATLEGQWYFVPSASAEIPLLGAVDVFVAADVQSVCVNATYGIQIGEPVTSIHCVSNTTGTSFLPQSRVYVPNVFLGVELDVSVPAAKKEAVQMEAENLAKAPHQVCRGWVEKDSSHASHQAVHMKPQL